MKYVIKIYFLLILIYLSTSCYSQSHSSTSAFDSTGDLKISFVKYQVTQSPDSLYFNIIKIENLSAEVKQGDFSIHLPNNFKLISSFNSLQEIPANGSIFIPIRVSIPKDVEGEKSYLVVADLKIDDKIYSKNSYISVAGKRKWDMYISQKKVYVNAYDMTSDILVNLKNKGNTTEMVKLEVDAGQLIELPDFTGKQDFIYVKLLPHMDTIIRIPTHYVADEDKPEVRNYWKESSLTVKSSNKIYERTDRIYFDHIESEYLNRKDQTATPLNLELQINNILSGADPRYNASVFGTVLFPKQREISYQFTGQNLMFKGLSEQNISFTQNTYYDIRYSDKNKFFEFGSQVGNSSLHHTYGQGLKGELRPNQYNSIDFSFIQGRFTKDFSASGMYTRKLRKGISINGGVTYEDNNSINYDAHSLLAGTRFSFLRYHSLGLQIALTNTSFNSNNSISSSDLTDTTTLGFSYQLYYAFRYKNFSFRASNTNSLHNFISNSNNDRWNIYSNYKFNDKLNAYFMFDRTKILSTRYPERFTRDANYNISDVGRLTFGYALSRDVYLMFGPVYSGISQKVYNSGYSSDYSNKHMAFFFSTRFKLPKNQSITPSMSLGVSRAHFEDTSPVINKNIESDYSKNFRAGLSYYNKLIRLNVFYNNGLAVVSRQQLLYDGAWVNSESIQIRPQVEKFFRNKTIRISSYVNYIYRMPSGRESVNFNLSLNFYLKQGWSLYASNNLYTTTRNDAELGRITNRVFNIFVGIRKSFDISQPRMKYYDYDFVFYHDVNGNKELNENERVIPNMLVNLQRDPEQNNNKSNFIETQLISDPNGRISYKNLPEGQYSAKLTSLDNLEDLYVLDGNDQAFSANENKTQYIPLTESYKVLGQIKLNRDKNSREGKVDLSNIRVTAQSEQGDTYAVLTDGNGGYILSIPQAGHYKVFVNNVLGEYFTLEKSEYIVDFNGIKSIVVDFVFNEKKRAVNFNNGSIYQFKSPVKPAE